jgi:hypothetical protein
LRYLFEFWKISIPPDRAALDLNFRQKKGFLSSLKLQTALEANSATNSIGTKGSISRTTRPYLFPIDVTTLPFVFLKFTVIIHVSGGRF